MSKSVVRGERRKLKRGTKPFLSCSLLGTKEVRTDLRGGVMVDTT